MSQILAIQETPAGCSLALASEALTASEWCQLLGIKRQAFYQERIAHSEQKLVRNTLTKVFAFDTLPERWRVQLAERRDTFRCRSYSDLLHTQQRNLRVRKSERPSRLLGERSEFEQEKAMKMRLVLQVYFAAQANGDLEKEANLKARAKWLEMFGKECSEKIIRIRAKRVEDAGGFELAPIEAYADERSGKPHKTRQMSTVLAQQLSLDDEQLAAFIAEVRSRATQPGAEHMSAVHFSLRLDWMMGREVPGLGTRRGNEEFPISKKQLRVFMPGTAARRLGSHGIARFERECAPWIHATVSTLRPLELVVLDDTRIDLICTDDTNASRTVELKAYILMDVATRRILGFTIKDGPIEKEDVSALLARFLRGCGLPTHYPLGLLFERGTIACADATETLLTSFWPGRVEVHRTSMDGGHSQAAGFWEAGSGHWMGKAWIESFMRTLAICLEQLPGQRGGDFRRQPASLGLKGRDHETGRLLYAKSDDLRRGIVRHGASSQMHEAALTGAADMAMRWIETGSVRGRPRLKANALRPKSWVIGQIAECIALYNAETDHRRDGFARIEYQGKDGRLAWRMESSDERWAALSAQWPAERIDPRDAAMLLKYRGKAVTVDARKGVMFDLAPWRGLRFWKPDSVACHQAGNLATQTTRMVALYDAEAFKTWRGDWPLEIHLIAAENSADKWKPGDAGRYLETLPLYGAAERTDSGAMARAAADKATVVRRLKLELADAAGARVARQLSDLEQDEDQLRGVIVRMDLDRPQMPASDLTRQIADREPQPDDDAPQASRAEQRREALAASSADAAEFRDALYEEE